MASIESRIDTFIAENNLDNEIKDSLCALITDSMGDLFKHVFNQPVPDNGSTGTATKAKKVLKAEKIEDPASCESEEDLRNCTTGVLNQFCKDHGLKVGGNKAQIMERVWRCIQGESSDEDKSSRGKGKAEKKKEAEKFPCAGCNIAGAPCGSSGTEEFGNRHFCWRHISDAQKFIDASEPVAKTEAKVSKAKAKPAAKPVAKAEPVKKPTKGKKSDPEPESEPEELETDEE
jgi:hypothetical protein